MYKELSDEQLLVAYQSAKNLHLDEAFLQLLLTEIKTRGLCFFTN